MRPRGGWEAGIWVVCGAMYPRSAREPGVQRTPSHRPGVNPSEAQGGGEARMRYAGAGCSCSAAAARLRATRLKSSRHG